MRRNEPVTTHEVELPAGQPLVSRTDAKGRITFANQAFVDVSGFSLQEMVGAPHNLVRHPDMPQEAFADLWATIKAGRPWEGLVKNRTKTGDFYWVRANVTPELEDGKLIGYVSIRARPTREQVARATEAYARIRASQSAGIGLCDGELVPAGLVPRLAAGASSVAGRLVACLAAAMLGIMGAAGVGLQHTPVGGTGFWFEIAMITLGLTLLPALGLLLMSAIRQPLRTLADAFTAIERNDLDTPIPTPGPREYRQVVSRLRAMRARLAFSIHEQAESDRRAARDRRAAIQAMADKVEQTARSTTESVLQSSGEMAGQSDDLAQLTERVSDNATAATQDMQQALANAQAVSASSEELSASIHEISSQIARASQVAQRAVDRGARAQERINSLSTAAERIGDVVALIRRIAGQTNLLADTSGFSLICRRLAFVGRESTQEIPVILAG